MTTSGGIGGLPPSGPAKCLPEEGCPHTYHSSGWCLAGTGQPVILLVQIQCDGSDVEVTTVDASTGTVIPNGPVIPCGDKDWEINQLCDVDPITGEVIATVTQIFEWDETTGAVVIRLERPDAPGIPYVPTGVLQTCAGGQLQAVETVVCGNTAGILRQLTEVVLIDTLDGTIKTVFYLDNGALAVLNPGEVVTAGDCWTSTLPSILDELEEANGTLTDIEANTDGLETCCAATNAALTAIQGQLTTIIGHVDGIEGLITATNAALSVLIGHVDGLEGLITASNVLLTTIASTVYAEDSPHVSGSNGTFVLGVRNDTGAAATSANGDYSPISTDSAGRVGISDLGGSISVDDNGGSLTVDGTVAVGPTVTPGTGATNLGKAEDSAHVSGHVGVMALGVRNDNDAVVTSADGDYSQMSVDSSGRLKTTGILTSTPAIGGGLSLYRNMDVGNVGQVIKASPGQIYNISARNRANEEIFLKFYNKATPPTAADVPVLVYAIDNNSGSKEIELTTAIGYAFSLGIGVRATNGIADGDNSPTDLNGLILNLGFK